jgi:serine/threonine protein kinase
MAGSLQQFVLQLIDSRLMAADEVEAFIDALPEGAQHESAEQLAQSLVAGRKLTPFQAKQLCEGQSKGLVLRDYVVLDKIGEGGMGEVFKAEQIRMGRIVALKTLPPRAIKYWDSVERFEREVRAAARLEHPNIVMAYDAGEDDGIHFLVMQFVNGPDLHTLVANNGRLPVEQAIDFTIQAAKGLDYAHAQNIIHRDIKPSNMLVDQSGTVKILDMGLARALDPSDAQLGRSLTATGETMGSVDYMSPEQAEDAHEADIRSDIYSLGCTMYAMLVGSSPFRSDTVVRTILSHREKPIPSIRDKRPDVDQQIDATFKKMVAKNPDDRFQSMTEVLEALGVTANVGNEPLSGISRPAAPSSFDVTSHYNSDRKKDGTHRTFVTGRDETLSQQIRSAVASEQTAATEARRTSKRVLIACLMLLATVAGGIAIWSSLPDSRSNDEPDRSSVTRKEDGQTTLPEDDKDVASQVAAIDLLKQIDTARDAVRGVWSSDLTGLHTPGGTFRRLMIPYRPPESYRLELEVTPRSDQTKLAVGLVIGGEQVVALIGDWKFGGDVIGFEGLDQQSFTEQASPFYEGQFFKQDEPISLTFTVKQDRVQVQCGRRVARQWTLEPKRLALPLWWRVPDTKALFLGAFNSEFVISKCQVHELDGHGTAGETSAELCLADRQRMWAEYGFYVYESEQTAAAGEVRPRVLEAEGAWRPARPGGQVVDGGLQFRPGADEPGLALFGQYIADLPAGRYEATVRMKSDAVADSAEIATVEAYDPDIGYRLSRGRYVGADFGGDAEFQEFTFPFYLGEFSNVETRLWWRGGAMLNVDRVTISRSAIKPAPWDVFVFQWQPTGDLDGPSDESMVKFESEQPLLRRTVPHLSLNWPKSDFAIPLVTISTADFSLPGGNYQIRADAKGSLRVELNDTLIIDHWYGSSSSALREVVTIEDSPQTIRVHHASQGDDTHVQVHIDRIDQKTTH